MCDDPMTSTPWHDYAANMTNAELANSLDYMAHHLHSTLAQAIMQLAAKRLRGEPEPHFVEPRPRDLPPLRAYAGPPAPDSTPLGLIIDRIAREAIGQ
jgi:hypothetical protein